MTTPARVLLALLLAPLTAVAHEGHEQDGQADPLAQPPSTLPPAMVLPATDGPTPWSDKPLLNDPRRFQIAIMTDRTGGHRPGVWMEAVRKINLLRPEFVVSVGDLIEGYTEDRDRIAAEWEEFLGFIDQMEMRFFFVAGNHDLTNPVMHEMWRDRFGPEWYSFDYKGVHFLCLCSEDPRQQHISQQQIEFIQKDLATHADARWTLVFLHKPLWTYAERARENGGADPTNWEQVEALLVDRPHTVFAGHVHNYVQYDRNGQNYYSLATTGGGSQLRGNEYGEFDHVTWLTMEPDGPHVVNLRLDGILPPGVVTEESATRFREFLRKATVRVAPILIDDESGFDEGDLRIELVNELGREVSLEGRVEGLPLRGVTVDPDGLRLSVGPTGTAEQAVRLRFEQKLPFDTLRRATFVAKMQTSDDPPLRAEREIPVIIDRRHACPSLAAPLEDGADPLVGWPERPYHTPDSPLVLGAAEDWQGPNDASLEVHSAHDDRHVYILLNVIDERVLPGDKVSVVVDPRAARWRRDDPRLRRGCFHATVAAPESTETGPLGVDTRYNGQPTTRASAVGRLTDDGYAVRVALPVRGFDRPQGGDWQDFQMTAVVSDIDDPGRPAAEVVWRGSPDYKRSNANFARFQRGE